MRKAKTKKAYREYLDEIRNEISLEEFEKQFGYMVSKERNTAASIRGLRNAYLEDRIGRFIEKYDPVRFEVGFNEWKLENRQLWDGHR